MNNEIEAAPDDAIENERKLANKALKIFASLCDIMPPIGFFSRDKRISAYITVTKEAQRLLDKEEASEGEILFVLSMMIRKRKDFQKSAMLVAMSLPKLKSGILSPIGFKYANDVRVNMRMSPVTDETSVQI